MSKAPAIFIGALCTIGFVRATEIRVPEQYETIQAAIEAAQEGDTILVAQGTYRERIALKSGMTLRSMGDDTMGKLGLRRAEMTIIDGGGEAGHSPGVKMAEGATLDGFTIRNVGNYDEVRWQKSWQEKGANQMHEHIGNFGTPAVGIMGMTCRVTGNIVHHNGDTGIAIRGEESMLCAPLVSKNVCYRNMGGGIGSMMGSTAVIDGNICFENFYAGIGHDNANPLVTRNECYRNIRAGIGVSEGASPTVRGNRCYGNRKAGIGIRTGAATRPLIEDNDCYENEMAGIGSDEEASPIIRGNRCYRNKMAGIGCREDSSPTIIENHCYENEAAGIGVDSSNAILLRNRVEKNKASGIGITGDSKSSLIENTCLENRLVAVGIPKGGEVVLQGNTFVRTGGMPPIVAILGGSRAILVANTIRGGGVAGVMVEGRLDAMENTIEGQDGGAGIFLRKGSKVKLAGNRISGYRTEVRDEGAKSLINEDTTPQK